LEFQVGLCSKKTFEGVLDGLEKRVLDFLRFLEAFKLGNSEGSIFHVEAGGGVSNILGETQSFQGKAQCQSCTLSQFHQHMFFVSQTTLRLRRGKEF